MLFWIIISICISMGITGVFLMVLGLRDWWLGEEHIYIEERIDRRARDGGEDMNMALSRTRESPGDAGTAADTALRPTYQPIPGCGIPWLFREEATLEQYRSASQLS